MITYKYDLDIVTGSIPVVVPLKQYSDDCVIVFNVYSRLGTLVLEEGTTVAIKGTKPDGNGISIDAVLSGNQVTVSVDKQMVAVAGKALYELVFSRNEKELITTSFVLYVQRAALDKNTLKSDSKIKELVNVIDRTDEIIEAANKADTACKSIEDEYNTIVAANDNVNKKYEEINKKAIQIAAVKTDADTIARQALEKASNAENEVAEFQNTVTNLKREDEKINLTLESKFDEAYVENGHLYLLANGSIMADITGIGGGSGGSGGSGGNNAVVSVTNTSGFLSKTISDGSSCIATIVWSSTEDGLPTGNGTLKVTANGIVKAMIDIQQGSVSVDLGKYASVGSNVIKLTVSDIYGNSRTINFSITSISLSLSSSFDSSVIYTGAILFPFTPTGNVLKTMHFILDGVEIGTMQTSVSGRQQSFTITQQTHGAHSLKCYFDCEINSEIVKSNELYFEIICMEELNDDIIIACDFDKTEVEQYSTVAFNYIVVNPVSLEETVEIKINGNTVQTVTVDRTKQSFVYRADDVGEMNVEIIAGASARRAYTFTVIESEIHVETEKEALVLNLVSDGRSNNEENPSIWESNGISANFSNFNFASDGWLIDENGATVLRVTGDARLEIPYQIFRNDFRTYGKTIEIKLKAKDVRNYDAEIISCYSGRRGLKVNAQKVTLQSEKSTMSYKFKDEEIVSITFTVEKRSENRLISLYIDGVWSQVIQYPENDDFSQIEPVSISIGSNDCTTDIYYIRVYDNDLTRHQVVSNYIASITDVDVMINKFVNNNIYDAYGNIVIDNLQKDLPYIIIECAELPQYKGDKKVCSGQYIDPINPSRSFTFENAQIDIQGTSSAGYERKNYKIKFKGGFIMASGNTVEVYKMREDSIGTNVFCFKADVASSEGCNNVELARLYNDTCPYKTAAQKANNSVRQGIDGFPIVMFWNNGNETTFLGKYNFNNDKGTSEVFGFSVPDESWEVCNNTSNRVLFKSDDFSGDGWLKDFEARYPEDYTDASQLQEFVSFVKSTDREQATNEALLESVTYDGVTYNTDTAEYRLAKFKNEVGNYVEIESMLFYCLFTELFLMSDSRAKNMFPSFIGDVIK